MKTSDCGKMNKMNKTDLLVSLRRTLVPIIVGTISGSFLAGYVDPAALTAVVSGVISAVYYAVLRLVEVRIPAVGALLGARKQPTYVDLEV